MGEWQVDSNGCPHVMRLADRYLHEKECIFSRLPCRFGCGKGPFLSRELPVHEQECEHRIVSCPVNADCAPMAVHLLQNHCKKVECHKGCGAQVENCRLGQHRNFQCPREYIFCPNRLKGCHVRDIRGNLLHHLLGCKCEAMSGLSISCVSAISESQKKLQGSWTALAEEYGELSRLLESLAESDPVKSVFKEELRILHDSYGQEASKWLHATNLRAIENTPEFQWKIGNDIIAPPKAPFNPFPPSLNQLTEANVDRVFRFLYRKETGGWESSKSSSTTAQNAVFSLSSDKSAAAPEIEEIVLHEDQVASSAGSPSSSGEGVVEQLVFRMQPATGTWHVVRRRRNAASNVSTISSLPLSTASNGEVRSGPERHASQLHTQRMDPHSA